MPLGREHCTIDTCDLIADNALYYYRPSLAMNALLTALFALSLALHLLQGVWYRTWSFLVAMGFGGVAEVIGYVARIKSWENPWNQDGFLAQICCLTIAPAFFAAGIYLCLSRIVTIYGAHFSRMPPVWYTRLFVTCDIVSLVLQGAGGGIAAVKAQNDQDPELGNNIMLAGVSFQVFTLSMFIALSLDFFLRAFTVRNDPGAWDPRFERLRASKRFRAFLIALSLSTVLILVRSIYRLVEMAQGWNGQLIREEVLFFVLEGVMVVAAVFALNALHPGCAMREAYAMAKLVRREGGRAEKGSERSSVA